MSPLVKFLVKNGHSLDEAMALAKSGKVQRITKSAENEYDVFLKYWADKKGEALYPGTAASKIGTKKLDRLYGEIRKRSPKGFAE